MKNYLSSPDRRQTVWDFMNEVDRIFDQSWRSESSLAPAASRFAPRADIEETEDFYLFSFDLPGLTKEDIKVEVNEDRLTLSGERKFEKKSKDGHFSKYERSYGNFERSFQLPLKVDDQKIQAHFENGVLEIVIPKAEVSKPKQVSIESGKGGLFSRILGKPAEAKDSH